MEAKRKYNYNAKYVPTLAQSLQSDLKTGMQLKKNTHIISVGQYGIKIFM